MCNILCITDSTPPLTIRLTTRTLPDNEDIQIETENNLYTLLMSEAAIRALAEQLSEEFEAKIKLDNVRMGSIVVDMMLEDLSKLEYIKDLSDKWVLSNIVDSILITPDFLESCQADYVELEAVVDEESYKQLRSQAGMLLANMYFSLASYVLFANSP